LKKYLQIAAIQFDIKWESKFENIKIIEKYLNTISKTDIVLLPEMFTTGFTMQAKKFSENMEGETIKWMKSWSKKLDSAIGGSIIVSEGFENKYYTKGSNLGIFEYKGWKICLRICYDLRFPVWSRNKHNYDLLIYVANWPEKRIKAWDTLLEARAIENMCYCLGVNRVGIDGNKRSYPGHTSFFNYLGDKVASSIEQKNNIISYNFEKDQMISTRKELKFLDDIADFKFQ
jgi:omega-amidase